MPSAVTSGNDTDSSLAEKEWFNAVAHKKEIENYIRSYSGRRDLDCLDLFGASGEVAACFERFGKRGAVYDLKINGPANDITAPGGFWTLVDLACRLKVGALIMAGPPCSLFIFLSSSVHKRKIDRPLGDTSLASVRLSNRIVQNMSVIIDIMERRGVFSVVEQPGSSQMFRHPVLSKLTKRATWTRIYTYMGSFNHAMVKPTVLWGNLPNLEEMKRSRPASDKFSKASSTFYIKTKFNGKKNVQGTKALQGSACYTNTFCKSLYTVWAGTGK